MADYYTSLSVLFPVGSAANVAPALALYDQLADELDADGETIGFEAQADEPPTGAHLWLYADESAEPEHVITFALRCAEALNLTGFWGFRWSLSCSRPRLDGYGGGAQLLDLGARRSVSWVDCELWISDEIDRLSGPVAAAAASLDECEAAKGWTAKAKAGLLLAFVDREIAANPAVSGRFRAFLAEVSARPDEMCCRECGEPMFIADAGTSHHWGSGMDGIDHDRDRDHVAIADTEK